MSRSVFELLANCTSLSHLQGPGQGVATEGQTCFIVGIELWLAAVATLTATWSLTAGGGAITPLRAQELYLKHVDSRKFEHIEGIVLSLRSVM